MSQEGERAELAAERDRLEDALQAIQLRMSSLSAALPASPACRAQPHTAPDAVRRERRLSGDPVYQPLLLCPRKVCSYAWDARPRPVIRMEAVLLRRLHTQLQAAAPSWQPLHVRAQRFLHRVSRCASPCYFQMASSIHLLSTWDFGFAAGGISAADSGYALECSAATSAVTAVGGALAAGNAGP